MAYRPLRTPWPTQAAGPLPCSFTGVRSSHRAVELAMGWSSSSSWSWSAVDGRLSPGSWVRPGLMPGRSLGSGRRLRPPAGVVPSGLGCPHRAGMAYAEGGRDGQALALPTPPSPLAVPTRRGRPAVSGMPGLRETAHRRLQGRPRAHDRLRGRSRWRATPDCYWLWLVAPVVVAVAHRGSSRNASIASVNPRPPPIPAPPSRTPRASATQGYSIVWL